MITRIAKLLCLCCLILLISCNVRITKTNFDKVQIGMNMQQVQELLGTPTSSATLTFGTNTVASVRWESRNGVIAIQLFNGTVKIKQFIEGVSTPRSS